MTTRTVASTPAPSTKPATARRKRTESNSSAVAPETGEIARRLRADLEKLPRYLADSATAAMALALAREIDDPDNSATSKSMCARSLLDAIDTLRKLTPAETKADRLDDLARRRAARVGKPTTAG